MSGYARMRYLDLRMPKTGNFYRRTNVPQNKQETRLSGVKKVCSDVVGHKDLRGKYYLPNNFWCTTSELKLPTFEGELRNAVNKSIIERKLDGWPCEYVPTPLDPVGYFPLTLTDQSNLAWRIIAATNPNTPHVSVPTFIGELRDIPGLIKGWGGSVISQMAKGHLTWRWGLKPMISDIRKMLTFVDSVNNRVLELEKLASGSYLKRRCGLGQQSGYLPPQGVIVNSFACFTKAFVSSTITCNTWGTSRWKLGSSSKLPTRFAKYFPGAETTRELAWRLATGATTFEALATAWELFPWSWYIDWFVPFGDVIAGANNTVGLNWSDLCIMRTMESNSIYTIDTNASDKWATSSGEFTTSFVRKERYVGVGPAGPPANLLAPLIRGKTWSILGSLWVLNSKNAKYIRRAKELA